MDLSNANTEPYRRYHDFHERLNVDLKIMTASAKHTIAFLEQNGRSLGDLIRDADPAWNYPPIWQMDGELGQSLIGAVGKLGIVSVWSALDAFSTEVMAEIDRYAGFSQNVVPRLEAGEPADSALERMIRRQGCRDAIGDDTLNILRYFGLIRNSIAHRDAKASGALAAYSAEESLRAAFGRVVEDATQPLPSFRPDQDIYIEPKLAIFYSHLGRISAEKVNQQLRQVLGQDGFIVMAVAHASSKDRPIMKDSRTLDALLNRVLYERYLVELDDGLEAPRRARELGVWSKLAAANPDLRNR